MININCIAETFYNCCNIPIKVICKNIDKIYTYGYNEHISNMYPHDLIKDALCKNKNKSFKLSIDSDTHYLILKECNVHFILGPITTNCDHKDSLIPYKPINCFAYIEDLLSSIICDSLNYNLSFKSYNTYVKKSIEYIHKNYNKDINIDILCDYLKINKSYFCNLFKKTTGENFSYFLNLFRIEKSKILLATTNLSLLDIALEVGYNNQNYFTIVFKKITNQTPSQYRKKFTEVDDKI